MSACVWSIRLRVPVPSTRSQYPFPVSVPSVLQLPLARQILPFIPWYHFLSSVVCLLFKSPIGRGYRTWQSDRCPSHPTYVPLNTQNDYKISVFYDWKYCHLLFGPLLHVNFEEKVCHFNLCTVHPFTICITNKQIHNWLTIYYTVLHLSLLHVSTPTRHAQGALIQCLLSCIDGYKKTCENVL
jgi:hypothetical protein